MMRSLLDTCAEELRDRYRAILVYLSICFKIVGHEPPLTSYHMSFITFILSVHDKYRKYLLQSPPTT